MRFILQPIIFLSILPLKNISNYLSFLYIKTEFYLVISLTNLYKTIIIRSEKTERHGDKMKKLISLFLTLAVSFSCLPAVLAAETDSPENSVQIESFDLDEGISGATGYDSINAFEGGGALRAFGSKINISRSDLELSVDAAGMGLKYAQIMLYTEAPEKIDISVCSLSVTVNNIKKNVNIFKNARLVYGWNTLSAVILISGNSTVSGYDFSVASADGSSISVLIDDLSLTASNKVTDPLAFSETFQNAHSFDVSEMSEIDGQRFLSYLGEHPTQRHLEVSAKELEKLMKKYADKAAVDMDLKEKNISSDNLLIHGRAFYDEGGLRMGYGACGFTVRFYGTALTGDFSFIGGAATDGGRSKYNVYVDTDNYCYDFDTTLSFPQCRDEYNENTPHFNITPGVSNRIVLCGKDEGIVTGLTEGVHTVTVLKRGEGGGRTSNGILNSLSCDGKFLTPPKNNARNIEIIGDSDSAAFGNLSIGTNLPWDPETEDTTLGYGVRTANFFGANFSITAKSGVCLLKSPKANEGYYTDNYFFTDNWSVGEKYKYDFASNPADVVFIYLGGNDFGRIQPTQEEFTEGMVNFIHQVRSVNPDSIIIVNSSRGAAAVDQVRNEGDQKVFSFTIGLSPRAGASGHPSMTAHIEGAQRFESAITEQTGWTSKQHEIFSDPTLENGTFEFSADYNETGTKVYITPNASHGFELKDGSLTAKTAGGELVAVEKDENGFYVIAPDSMVMVSGEFEQAPFMAGDVDKNQKLEVNDALLILQKAVGKTDFDEIQMAAGDLDKNGEITVNDALLALQAAVGKIQI